MSYLPYGIEQTSTPNGQVKFGTYLRDGNSSTLGADYADQRYYNPWFGRFNTPDPSGMSAVDPANPISWNMYAYVNGDPVNGLDPSGLCDVVMGGITQNSGNAGAVEEFAASNNSISVYPYSANSNTSSLLSTIGSALAGIAEVAVQSLTAQSSTYAAVTGLLLAAQDGKPINVTTFSGGAAALTAAVAFLNGQGEAGQAVVSMISSITYVAPGAAQSLYNNGNATFIGGGALNNLVGAGTSISQPANVLLDKNNCGHNFQCLIDEFPDALSYGDPCSKPVIVNQPPRYFFNPTYDPQWATWSPFNIFNLPSMTVPYVTSRILPP